MGSLDAPVATVVDTRTGEEVFRLEGHTWPVNQATWSPDGTWIATVSGDGPRASGTRDTGAPRFTLEGHSASVNAADWSPDSRRLVTGSMDGTARVWKITEQGAVEQLALSSVDTRNGIFGVVFSPDGGRVMAGVFAITAAVVWDVTIDGSAELATLPAVETCWVSPSSRPTARTSWRPARTERSRCGTPRTGARRCASGRRAAR